jgi:hypothetical protein
MKSDREEATVEPDKVELTPESAQIQDTPVPEKPGEDRRHMRPPLPRGPFRPVTDLGEETTVEESDRGANNSKR